jgi:hypothetical protein
LAMASPLWSSSCKSASLLGRKRSAMWGCRDGEQMTRCAVERKLP